MRGLLGAIALAAALLGGSAAAASASGSVTCHLYTGIPVSLAGGEPARYTISGEMCATPAELTNGTTVQLLIHGATYNHTYWDFGSIDGARYSYARDVAADGYPTFSIDEVGTAETVPLVPSADITITAMAHVAHEIVQDLLGGQITGVRFGKVIEVGHSQGSFVSWFEAATYDDVAGLIITGAAHSTTQFEANVLFSDFHPAVDDDAFVDSGLDSGYLTTIPATRATLFYDTSDADPDVIAHDEATKDVDSGNIFTEPLQDVTLPTAQIDVPVLVVLGGADRLFCGTEITGGTFRCGSGQQVANEEAPNYSPQAHLRACVVASSGHDINLALNHGFEETDADVWANEYVGQLGVPGPASRALPPGCNS